MSVSVITWQQEHPWGNTSVTEYGADYLCDECHTEVGGDDWYIEDIGCSYCVERLSAEKAPAGWVRLVNDGEYEYYFCNECGNECDYVFGTRKYGHYGCCSCLECLEVLA